MVPFTVLRSLGVALVVGVATWLLAEAIDPQGRSASIALVAGLAVSGGVAYLGGVRLLGANISLNPRGWRGNPTIEPARE